MTAALLPRRRSSGPGLAERSGRPRAVADEGASLSGLERQARRIREQSLEYHVCRGFKRLHFERPIVSAHAHQIGERTLLTAEQEADLFLRLNYCKFRADVLRRQLPRETDGERLPAAVPLMAEIEGHFSAATQLRDALVRAFLKLAISLLGPFLSRRHGFEELLSEATMALLRAIEMFDPERGFRFSTYATPAVRRRLERFVTGAHKDRQRLVRTAHLDTVPAPSRPAEAETRRREAAVSSLKEMFSRLDAREQWILRARFGLEPGCAPQSLQEVAVQVGVCRERVRQIEARALEKLRGMPEAAGMQG